MKELLKENKYYYIEVLVFVLAGAIILLTNTKAEITIWVNTHYGNRLDAFVYNVNTLGDLFFSISVFVVVGLVTNWRLAAKAAACFIGAALVTQICKHIFFPGELRPTLYFPVNIPEFKLRLMEGVVQLQTESFPSGHTTAAFSIVTFLALYNKSKEWNWILGIIALFVGYGRIYMSQHFVTDVYVGMLIGVIITTLIYYYYPKKWCSE